jgi:16S rRNA G966 N2-methylase RsmD
VEQDRRIAAVARANLAAVTGEAPPCWELHCREVGRWLARSAPEAGEDFDLIYADPPYAAGLYDPIAAGVAAGAWLKPGGTLIWECASDAVPDVPAGWRLRDTRRYGSTTLVLLQQV